LTDFSNRGLYRRAVTGAGYIISREQADIFVAAPVSVREAAQAALDAVYADIKSYLAAHAEFGGLIPIMDDPPAPAAVRRMIRASAMAGVGPMAAVAGAVCEAVAQAISALTDEFSLENGGDIFLRAVSPRVIAVFAGRSPLSMKTGIRLPPGSWGVCTSSGTVGPSLSFGRADAAAVVSPDPALADACATRLGNMISHAGDIAKALETISAITGVTGALGICGDALGAIGDIEVLPL
jgi:uncharacterized protein